MSPLPPACLRARGLVRVTDNLPPDAHVPGRLVMMFYGKAIRSRALGPAKDEAPAEEGNHDLYCNRQHKGGQREDNADR